MHGDVFPLPVCWREGARHSSDLSRGVAQRLDRHRARRRASAEAAHALNALAGFPAAAQGHSFEAAVAPSAAQAAVLDAIWQSTEEAPPKGENFAPEAALQALLRVDSKYVGSTSGLAPFKAGAVSLPKGQSRACPIERLLSGQALEEVLDSDSRMLLSGEELEGALEAGVENCFHDPCLRHSPRKYLEFVCELYKCGVVQFSEKVRVEVGCFFVYKKDGRLRLILDARRCFSNTSGALHLATIAAVAASATLAFRRGQICG